MKIKYIGQRVRTNSFGTFEPGKTYDAKEEVGRALLTAPNLFVKAEKPKADKATKQKAKSNKGK